MNSTQRSWNKPSVVDNVANKTIFRTRVVFSSNA